MNKCHLYGNCLVQFNRTYVFNTIIFIVIFFLPCVGSVASKYKSGRTVRLSLGAHEQRSLTVQKISGTITSVLITARHSQVMMKRLQSKVSDPELNLYLLLPGDLLIIVMVSEPLVIRCPGILKMGSITL